MAISISIGAQWSSTISFEPYFFERFFAVAIVVWSVVDVESVRFDFDIGWTSISLFLLNSDHISHYSHFLIRSSSRSGCLHVCEWVCCLCAYVCFYLKSIFGQFNRLRTIFYSPKIKPNTNQMEKQEWNTCGGGGDCTIHLHSLCTQTPSLTLSANFVDQSCGVVDFVCVCVYAYMSK